MLTGIPYVMSDNDEYMVESSSIPAPAEPIHSFDEVKPKF